MRTPDVKYYKMGYIKFKKVDGVIHYQMWQYDVDGMLSYIVDQGIVKDEQHLKELQSLGNVKT